LNIVANTPWGDAILNFSSPCRKGVGAFTVR
jgi:hypothetical protein